MATRCVHCGAEMESLFTLSGQAQRSDEESEDSLSDIIEEIRNDPSLKTPVEVAPIPEIPPADQIDESVLNSEELPDWLVKVRERAQEEEDAIGDLASGTIAMDAARSEAASAGVEGEFNAWINRIREKSQQENNIRARRLPNESEDPEQVPDWLQRIRSLRPQSEEEITHEVKANPGYVDEMPLEWTDEALEELRRQALAEDHEQETEPLLPASPIAAEDALPGETETEEPGELVEEEPELIEEDFHNIPDEEEEIPEPLPKEDPSHLSDAGEVTPAEEAVEKPLETEEIEAAEKEPYSQAEEVPEDPGQDLAQQDDVQSEETWPEEAAPEEEAPVEAPVEPKENEIPDQIEPEPYLAEDESELPSEEQHEEPAEAEQPTDSAAVPPDLLLLRDQQDRASLLASLIEEEGRVTAGKQAIQKPSGRAGRMALALLLLIGLVVSILIGPAAMPADTPKSIPALALSDQIQALAEIDKVLVVLDYQAATSRELEALAAPLLIQLHDQGTQLEFLTTQPSGLFLAQSLLAQAGLAEDTQVDYLPGSYLGMISSAATSPVGDGNVKNLHSFQLVLLVSDSSENIRGWLGQIAPWVEPLKFGAVSTQMEAPMLAPYFESSQLVGYAAGIADGNLGSQTAFSYRAYRVGLLLMLVMLLLGMISKGEADAIRREEERGE